MSDTVQSDTVRWIAERRRNGTGLADMPDAVKPADEAVAYRVQDDIFAAMRPEWGGLVGWKIGVTTPQMQAYLGIGAPIAGAMPERLRRAPNAKLRFAEFCRIGIECEVAVVMKAPLGPGATQASASEAVDTIHPAIELVDDRYGGEYAKLGVPAIVADFAFHAGFVLGPSVPNWREIDLAAVQGVTRANGTVRGRGRGGDVMGHPMASLAWLANRLGALGKRIEPGQVVMTGSLPLPYWAGAGERVEIEIEQLGSVAIDFV